MAELSVPHTNSSPLLPPPVYPAVPRTAPGTPVLDGDHLLGCGRVQTVDGKEIIGLLNDISSTA